MRRESNPLPYQDSKPQGAADFYFAINATFRFIFTRLGRDGWVNYLRHLGQNYFRPSNEAWRVGGLPAVADYWRAFFAAEPGSEVAVHESPEEVEIEVTRCPAIHHLRQHGRDIFSHYCEHCFLLGSARAEAAGFEMRLAGGNGACRHRYRRPGELPPQNYSEIKEEGAC